MEFGPYRTVTPLGSYSTGASSTFTPFSFFFCGFLLVLPRQPTNLVKLVCWRASIVTSFSEQLTCADKNNPREPVVCCKATAVMTNSFKELWRLQKNKCGNSTEECVPILQGRHCYILCHHDWHWTFTAVEVVDDINVPVIVHLFFRSFNNSFIHLLIHSFIHTCMHPSKS